MIDQKTKNLVKKVTGLDITQGAYSWTTIESHIPSSDISLDAERLRQLCKAMQGG